MQLVSSRMSGPLLPREKLVESLEALIVPADRIVLEGDNRERSPSALFCEVCPAPQFARLFGLSC
jgi:hypothetical protein